MYTRRGVIRNGGGAVAAATVLSLSGCFGDDGREEYDAAVDLLERNGEAIDAHDLGDEDFDAAQVRRRAETAEEHLDAASADADDELQGHVEDARAVAAYQRHLATFHEEWLAFEHCLDDAGAMLDAERWDDANDELERCDAVVDDLESLLEDLRDAHEDVDADRLDEEARLDHERMGDGLDDAERALSALEEFLQALDQFADGLPALGGAVDDIDREAWADAERGFESARDDFAAAAATLSALEDDPDSPSDIRSDVIQFRCEVEAMRDAADSFAAAVAAIQREDWEASDDHLDDAEAHLDSC